MKVAVYGRVSTKDKKQNPETQLRQLREYVTNKKWSIFDSYVDYESGCKSSRPEFNRLKKDALHRRFDTILVWKMDRFSRRGIKDVFNALDYFSGCNVAVVSLTEPYLSTDTPMKELLLAILAWGAKMESENLGIRVKAGLERAKAEGKHLGRPKKELDEKEVVHLYEELNSTRKVAEKLDVSHVLVYNLLLKKHPKILQRRKIQKNGVHNRNDKLTDREGGKQ